MIDVKDLKKLNPDKEYFVPKNGTKVHEGKSIKKRNPLNENFEKYILLKD